MSYTTDLIVFLTVVAARLLIPLFIPRFPLPAIIASLVIDAADQTIFQQYTTLEERGYLEGYQSYDKALDIYYLTIAYTSTMRNWGGGFLFDVGRFLWYYRLVGVMIFENTGAELRWLLLVFPNTFEYFFIAIEAYKTRRSPFSLVRRQVVLIAASIWIFIKLPQEWWIHVAKLDFTNVAKQDVFGVAADASWGEALTNRPLVTVLLAVAVAAVVVLLRRLAAGLPPADWRRTLDADRQGRELGWGPPARRARPLASFGLPFVEKAVLVGFVASIFAQILPGVESGPVQMVVSVAILIAVNTVLSEALARREVSWRSAGMQFIAMAAANLAIVYVYYLLGRRDGDADFQLGNTLFLVGLITLIVVLFDRFRDIGLQHRVARRNPVVTG